MESFYRTHCHLVEHTHASIRRGLMDEIDWNDRLIGIKGTRGVGKTTFLLQYAKEKFGTDPSCLYINMNNFYFSLRPLLPLEVSLRFSSTYRQIPLEFIRFAASNSVPSTDRVGT